MHACRKATVLAAALLLGATACRAPAASHDATAHHDFVDVAHWAAVFDDPARDAWQKPDAVVGALGLRPGMTVADLGAGTGYFERRLAGAVGAVGTVFAVDTEPGMVEHLRARAEREGTDNVVPVLASPATPRLPAGAVDVVLIVDTFHHLDDRLAYLHALRRVLRPGGRVAIVDWRKRPLPVGPPPEHKLPRGQVVEEMEAAGYALVGAPDVLPYQYFLIFAPR
ncbi:MAG TPA: methyltransferase domain-containing protein [Candidatus Binatia bacterium]|nr:methyltransferase domain-containing protein [Candidatus Binatia bacterium]